MLLEKHQEPAVAGDGIAARALCRALLIRPRKSRCGAANATSAPVSTATAIIASSTRK